MIDYPTFDPVIFSIGPLAVRWYGLMYVLGFAGGWWLARRRCTRPDSPVTPEQVDDLAFYVMLGVILGGRIGYTLIYGWDRIAADPLYIFRIWEGGMSFHGGLAGVVRRDVHLYGRKLGKTTCLHRDGFRDALVPSGLCTGPHRQFHQRRAVGQGDGVPWAFGSRASRAIRLAALRGGARRRRAVHHPVALFRKTASRTRGVRHVPLCYGVLPLPGWSSTGAGRPHGRRRLPRLRLAHDRPGVDGAHDRRRRDAAALAYGQRSTAVRRRPCGSIST